MTDNFDESMDKLQAILDDLEANSDNMTPEEIENKLKEAEELKEICKRLLKEEKEDIIRTAKENNIPLEELGLTEGDDDFDDLEEDEDDEDAEGDDSVKF